MKEWSDKWRGVTERLVVMQHLVKTRSRMLPALCEGEVKGRQEGEEGKLSGLRG